MSTATETPIAAPKGGYGAEEVIAGLREYKYGWQDSSEYASGYRAGFDEELVREISASKNEPEWMLKHRLRGLKLFDRKPMPTWGPDFSRLDIGSMTHFMRATEGQSETWAELPEDIQNTYERLGIPAAEQSRLIGGVAAMYESEAVYHSIQSDLTELGIIFLDMDTAVREQPELVERYFGTVVPAGDNKFAALNTALWSGGAFVYVPKDVVCPLPLQAYFRMNKASQHERTLIIVEEGASVTYMEGCSASKRSEYLLHAAVVELIAKPRSKVNYLTIQAWDPETVYNLTTKRAAAQANAHVSWTDINGGAKVTCKYPSVYLLGEGAHGEVLSAAIAGPGQHQDTGAKMIHAAPNTTSSITSKSISYGGGRTSYRGLVQVQEGAKGSRSSVVCDALLVDTISRSDTYPYVDIREDEVSIGHEATVSKVGDEQLFYLMQRGLTQDESMSMILKGFLSPIVSGLPMEYALEMNRMLELKMEGSVG